MSSDLDDWLADGSAPEADWGAHVSRLATRGGLGRAGKVLLDLPALAQPFSCLSGECTPGRRAPRTKSCCADLDVSVSPRERAAIEGALPEIAAFFAPRDPRWASGAPEAITAEGTLARPGRRCVFSVDGPDGLRCGLHLLEDATGRDRGALKPLPCRLFPLVVVDLDGQRLLTAIHKSTARSLEAPSPRIFPCLRADPSRPALVESVADTLAEVFGARTANGIRAAVRAWRSAGA